MSEAIRSQGRIREIREILSQLPMLQVGEDVYLKLEDVLDATGDILYPEGLRTQEEYDRLVLISKAGCRAIGYSEEELTLLPPVVPFRQRGTYLKKMPAITDETIAPLLGQLAETDYERISSPYVAITRKMLIGDLAHKYLGKTSRELTSMERKYLTKRCDEVAKKLGWSICNFDFDPNWPAGEIGYAKAMKPDMEACREAITRVLNSWHGHDISYVLRAGLQAAFANRVNQDPEEFISYETWRDLFNQLGYIYDPKQTQLIPKPLNLSDSAQNVLATAISGLRTYNHPKIGAFLIKDNVMQVAKEALELTITKARLEQLVTDGIIGRVLIKLGYQLTTRWLTRYELTMLPKKVNQGAEVYTRAIQIDHEVKTPTFAKGFTIHSPVLVRDERTLVYMELLGPRQAVKANWAALRQHKKSRYFHGGQLEITKEDKPITLKTTLPCGWDHWCLIHRQASYDKLIPQKTFYLIDHNPAPSGPPSTFIPFLAKSLSIPILPEWAEYLWTEGRMQSLILPLTKNCYGHGGWKVETTKDAWDTMVSEGLGEKQIQF